MKSFITKTWTLLITLGIVLTVSGCGTVPAHPDRSIAQEECEELYFIDNENFFENYERCRERS